MAVKEVFLVSPRGFCGGVVRAIDVVEECLQLFGAPVYVKHEIVHNKHVVNDLRQKGAIFVEEISEIPADAVAIYSAHGVSPSVRAEAKEKRLRTIDATCPLVTKMRLEVQRFAKEGNEIVYIGHKGHPEAVGVLGIRPDITQLVESVSDVQRLNVRDPKKLACLTQTTLSVDETMEIVQALQERFPKIQSPPAKDICYATTNRQEAIKEMAKRVQLVLVVGSKNSSNSNRLVETAKSQGIPAHLVDDASGILSEWLHGVERVGVSAGASAPEKFVQEVVQYFERQGATLQPLMVIDEHVKFAMPRELVQLKGKN